MSRDFLKADEIHWYIRSLEWALRFILQCRQIYHDMTKIALVDDHKLLRKGLASLVSDQGYDVVLQADNGAQFIENLEKGILPDVVLLHINMPIKETPPLLWRFLKYPP